MRNEAGDGGESGLVALASSEGSEPVRGRAF